MTAPRLLAGRYEVGERVGRGGMADVHRGTDVRLGRDVAIKLLRPDLARDPSFQGRFRREAQGRGVAQRVVDRRGLRHRRGPGRRPQRRGRRGRALHRHGVRRGPHAARPANEEGRLLPERALELTADVCRRWRSRTGPGSCTATSSRAT
jgi:serine/threonine-protein kinase